jgi:hypothetical protein
VTAVLRDVHTALAWRATGEGQFTHGDWGQCARLTLELVADANARWGPR